MKGRFVTKRDGKFLWIAIKRGSMYECIADREHRSKKFIYAAHAYLPRTAKRLMEMNANMLL